MEECQAMTRVPCHCHAFAPDDVAPTGVAHDDVAMPERSRSISNTPSLLVLRAKQFHQIKAVPLNPCRPH